MIPVDGNSNEGDLPHHQTSGLEAEAPGIPNALKRHILYLPT
jgi:hypothetical protein